MEKTAENNFISVRQQADLENAKALIGSAVRLLLRTTDPIDKKNILLTLNHQAQLEPSHNLKDDFHRAECLIGEL
ncbi:hypothetical protein [Pantoea septica]|uniref:hypothetical protein n=1 Tax=Pantoea septica TaxID=472695 RepID=UPI003D07D297